MTSRRISAVVAFWLLAPGAAAAQLAQPLDLAPERFARGLYDEAGEVVLRALAAAEPAVAPERRAALLGQVVQAYADNRQVAPAMERAAAAASPGQRALGYALIAVAMAREGERPAGIQAMVARVRQELGSERPDALMAGGLAEALALAGEDEEALALARAYPDRLQRTAALVRVALAGPTGRPERAPEQAWAELRGWVPALAQPGYTPYVVAAIARAQVRYGDGNGAPERAASIGNREWRATAFAWIAGELPAWQLPGVADRALRRAEESAGLDPAAAPEAVAARVPPLPLAWIAYAYARVGERERAGQALAALLIWASARKEPHERAFGLALAAGMIGRTRQHIAEAQGRVAVPPAQPPAQPPAGTK